nr:hypothetical protein [Bosea sp. BIWAKO-01]
MNGPCTLASAPHRAASPGRSRPPSSLASLRKVFATWRWRLRFRWQLARTLQESPHLIRDIGLTTWQVEEEIAKPFWRR